MKRILAFILCLMMLTSSMVFVNAAEPETTQTNDDQIVVAYFNASAYPGSKDFTNIDVLNYHPAHIETGALGYSEGNPIIVHNQSKNLDSWKQKAYAQNPDIKFVFTVANGNIQVFESWFSSPDRAKRLAKEMLSIIETYGFDGLDIDYEFPSSGNNPKNNYVRFMQYMREGFDELSKKTGKDYILSMAVPAGEWAFSLFKMNDLAKYVSYFNIMSYDLHVGNATKGITHHHTNPCADPTPGFEGGSVEEDIALYREKGIPDDKIVVGIGMYARRWTNVPNVNNGLYQSGTIDETTNEAYLHYSAIKSSYENKRGYVKYWDDVAKAPYLYNAEKGIFLTYDDEQSAEIKCEIAVTEGVRGVMVFDYVTTDGIGFFDKLQTWLDKYVHTHSYTGAVTTEPTCSADGVMTYTCECGDSYSEPVPATGEHNHDKWIVDTEPTCGAEGVITYTCECGHSYSESVPATGEHNHVEWIVDTEPGYNSYGLEFSICTECGFIAYNELPMREYVNPFIDVKESHWFYDAVEFCVKAGYVAGMTENTFAPNNNLTRAQFLMMLAKADGADVEQYKGVDSGFEDVKPTHWYNEVVCWAVENGYTSGLSETKFGPNNNITRAQLARFFYVYVEKNGMDVSESADLSVFPDANKVQSWAEVPVKWAVARGFIAGMNGKLEPNGNSTRAQAARIMMLVAEAEFVSADPLDRIFESYPEKLMFFTNFENIENVSRVDLFSWGESKVEEVEFIPDNDNMTYTYVYNASDIASVIKSYFGVDFDFTAVVGRHDGIEIKYNAEAGTVTVIYYGGFGFGGPSPIYDGYTQIDDTHFVIHFTDVDYDRQGELDIELVDGNYIVTAKRYL